MALILFIILSHYIPISACSALGIGNGTWSHKSPGRRKPCVDNSNSSVAKLNDKKEKSTWVSDCSEVAEAT